jgi:hypothetical protein
MTAQPAEGTEKSNSSPKPPKPKPQITGLMYGRLHSKRTEVDKQAIAQEKMYISDGYTFSVTPIPVVNFEED